jgi:hypothetical protein
MIRVPLHSLCRLLCDFERLFEAIGCLRDWHRNIHSRIWGIFLLDSCGSFYILPFSLLG